MKNLSLLTASLFILMSQSALATPYKDLPRDLRDLVEQEMLVFVPDYADSLVAIVQDTFRYSTEPLNRSTWLREVKFSDGKTFGGIMASHRPSKLPDNRFGEGTDLSLKELLSASGGAILLAEILDKKQLEAPAIYESRYLDTLNSLIDVPHQEKGFVSLWLQGLARPYCGIVLDVGYHHDQSGTLIKTSESAYENCD